MWLWRPWLRRNEVDKERKGLDSDLVCPQFCLEGSRRGRSGARVVAVVTGEGLWWLGCSCGWGSTREITE